MSHRPVNLASFVFFELLGGALAAGLFRLTETGAGPSAAKDDKAWKDAEECSSTHSFWISTWLKHSCYMMLHYHT